MRLIKLTSVAIGFVSIVLMPQTAMAHGDQNRIYPGTLCKLRGDALRGEGNFNEPMWKFLAISQFGYIGNKSRTKDIPVICPIERGAISKTTGITVSVKFSTIVRSVRRDDLDHEFRCTLTNVDSQGKGAHRSDESNEGDLRDVIAGVANTLTLSLQQSNRVASLGAADGGGYVLACWLPRVRQQPGSSQEFETRLIHFAVKERD